MVSLFQIFVIGCTWMSVPVLFGEMMQTKGWTIASLMAAWGAIPLAIIFINFPAGIVGDKFGMKVAGIGAIMIGIVGALRGLAPTSTMFYFSMLAYGATFPFAFVLMPKALGSYFPPAQLGMANGVSLGAYGLGAAGALQLSGTVISPAVGGWQNVIYLYSLIALACGILWLLTVKDPPVDKAAAAAAGPAPSLVTLLVGLLKNTQVLIICLIYFMFLGGWIGMSGAYPSLGVAARGISHGQSAFVVTFALLTYVAGCFIFPTISDKVGLRRPVYCACLLISGFGMFMTAITADYTMILVWAAVWGLFAGAIPIVFAIPFETPSVGVALGGAAIGLILAAGNIGGFLFPTFISTFAGGEPTASLLKVGILCGLFGYAGTALVIWMVNETGSKARAAAAAE